MNPLAKDKVIRARAALLVDQPFFGQLSLRLHMRERQDIETFATDQVHLDYNSDFVMKISSGQTKTEVCHEVLHCALDHVGRMGWRDPVKWNYACDYAINPILKDLGMEMDDTYLLEDAFRGMSAEHIYSLLPDNPKDGSGQGGQGGQGQGHKGRLPPPHVQPNPAAPQTPAQQRDWKVAVAQSAQAAKVMGKLPGSLEKFIDHLLNNRVDWKTVLRKFVTQSQEGDFHWLRPNRMMLGKHRILLPGLWSEKTKPIVVVKDISMSIDDAIQDAFNAEIRAIAQDTRPEMTHVMYCDTRIEKYDQFDADTPVVMENIRGGGTRFEPPFELIEEKNIQPACLVYLTDLQGSFPDTPPNYPVLWACIDEDYKEPPFGEVMVIEL